MMKLVEAAGGHRAQLSAVLGRVAVAVLENPRRYPPRLLRAASLHGHLIETGGTAEMVRQAEYALARAILSLPCGR